MAVLVTGGAGYIGSHMVARLRDARRSVVVVDDLSTGHAENVPRDVPFVRADIGDQAAMKRVFAEHAIDAVIHFAAQIQVGESVVAPRRYWMGNVVATARLLECVLEAKIGTLIFSSTAAVYGTPERVPISETDRTAPINPYGQTKLAIEHMLAAYSDAYDLRYAALRYFNAAGAEPDAGLGERHDPETHLIPLVLDAALGRRGRVCVFGSDYDTPDGTCIRDYVHVTDLADAHLAALHHLEAGGEGGAFNLGTGSGQSVAAVIATCREVTGRPITVEEAPRREGDAAILVASPRRAQERLGWRAWRSDLRRIVEDAWNAHLRLHTDTEPRIPKRAASAEEEHAHVR